MFKELPPSLGLVFNNRTADSHWGKPEVIDALIEIGKTWAATAGNVVPPISIGQISRKNGGKFPPHNTHREGDDVDIRPMRRDGHNAQVTWRDAAYSQSLTRDMIKTIRANAPIKSILFSDPVLIDENLCIAYPNHSNHLHVNFMPAPKSSTRSTLRRGDTGTSVQDLQRKLGIKTDGSYGPDTEKAVREFQAEHGLKVDGIVGPESNRILFEEK